MRFSKFVFSLVAAAALLLVADIVSAQPPGGGRPGGGFGGVQDEFDAVRQRNVQQILELEEDQVGKIRDLSEEFNEDLQEARAKLVAKYAKELEDVLLPHQAELLLRATIQLQGDNALQTNKSLQAKLGISDSQVKKMADNREKLRDKQRELFEKFRDGGSSREEIRDAFTKMREEGQDAVVGVLTSKQKTEYEKLKGEPIEGLQRRFGGFGGGRPGGGEGRPGGGRPGGGRPRPDTE